MPSSVWSNETKSIIVNARLGRDQTLAPGQPPSVFPSPADWRDQWIYQILVDRFNNPQAPPRQTWDGEINAFQGGTFNGIREQLGYLQDLNVGALWLSPVLKNCQYNPSTYHGYGIQDFLSVDPRFASDPEQAKAHPELAEAELRALVDEAHARDIYIIFDIVLNHAGDVFGYTGNGSSVPWSDTPLPILWHDENGQARPDWAEPPPNPSPDATIWPSELRQNEYFRRQGNAFSPNHAPEAGGDFFSLKQFDANYQSTRPNYYPVRDILIRAYQYIIAKFDVDGFRIDTLKYLPPDFAQVFGNAIREYALSIGKKNFFTFGEVYDSEDKIAGYIGRNACSDSGDLVGVDAALDFPLFFKLPSVIKGFMSPSEIAGLFEFRKQVQRGILSSHGEASRFFVTFLDNHDQYQRIYYSSASQPHQFDDQVTAAVACLFSLQGIPCLYYGTEQGLHGAGGSLEAVREALWGKPDAFNPAHPFYQTIKRLADVRSGQPALRYGRQYFRPVSGDSFHFGISSFPGGVLAFSRILQDEEVLVIANPSALPWSGQVIVDSFINAVGSTFDALFSNKPASQVSAPSPVEEKSVGVEIHEANGTITHGPIHTLSVNLQPMEVQFLGASGTTI